MTALVSIPRAIPRINDEPAPPEVAPGAVLGVPGGISPGASTGMPGGIGSAEWAGSVPPPKASKPVLLRVGGQVSAAKLVYQPKPEYPPLAKMARIQGTVQLEASIGKDGAIQDLKVPGGHPLLVKAALEAVRRWRYQPTMLNGEPVDVLTEINVSFTLAE